MKRILIALCLSLAPVAAFCQAAAPASPSADPPAIELPKPSIDEQAEQKTVQAWGREHAECSEWSDGCVACTKDGCSTPGIACTPREIACRRK